jgi:hypothetical protein
MSLGEGKALQFGNFVDLIHRTQCLLNAILTCLIDLFSTQVP